MDSTDLTRRRVLAGLPASLAAGAVLARPPPALEEPQPVDVVIVGAGIAGLVAARQLVKAGKRVALSSDIK